MSDHTDPTPVHDTIAALDRATAALAIFVDATRDATLVVDVATETLAALQEFYPSSVAAVSRRRALEGAYFDALVPESDGEPYDLDLPEFLACCDAMDVSTDDLANGLRPGCSGPRWCVHSPDGTVKLGPAV